MRCPVTMAIARRSKVTRVGDRHLLFLPVLTLGWGAERAVQPNAIERHQGQLERYLKAREHQGSHESDALQHDMKQTTGCQRLRGDILKILIILDVKDILDIEIQHVC